MKRTSLIRLGGLAAMVGAALYVSLDFLRPLWPWSLPEWRLDTLFLELGALAAIAAIAALSVLEVERWKLPWLLVASLVAFVSAALILVWVLGGLMALAGQELPGADWLVFVGLLVGTVSLVALGSLVIDFEILPWWGGAALILGSPLSVFLLEVLFAGVGHSILRAAGVWSEPEGLLTGLVWAVVGYAIFRAAGQRTERPSRVR